MVKMLHFGGLFRSSPGLLAQGSIGFTLYRHQLAVLLLCLWPSFTASTPPHLSISCDEIKNNILCLPNDYSKFDLPFRNSLNAIKIGIEISDVLKIDDKDYSITYSLYFTVEWHEPRLNVNLSEEFWPPPKNDGTEEWVPVNLELINDLWVPNIFIYNLKTFKVIDVLSKLAGLWINKKKRILYSQATHITFICPMKFDSFPLDTQLCKFQVGSYSYDNTKMTFEAIFKYVNSKAAQSIILDYEIKPHNLTEGDKIFLGGELGNYSLAGFQLSLTRHVMSYIITYYLPSGLFVVVSWISFLIPPDIVPGRMALLITLFLVLINIFNNVTTNSPKAEGLTAIEIWMLACILFVFGSLIEYAVILYKKQKTKHYISVSNSPSYQDAYSGEHNAKNGVGGERTPHNSGTPSILHTKYDSSNTNTSNYIQDTIGANYVHLLNQHGYDEATPVMLSARGGATPVSVLCRAKQDESELRRKTEEVPLEEDVAVKKAKRKKLSKQTKFDSLKRQRCKSYSERHFHTWHDRYGSVDQFFLVFSPLLFLVFNVLYWFYFIIWDMFFNCYLQDPSQEGSSDSSYCESINNSVNNE